MLRRTTWVAAVLMATGLMFGAAGTAMAAGQENTPTTAPTPAATTPGTKPGPTPTGDAGDTRAPKTTVASPTRDDRREKVSPARPARPVPATPNFTG